VSDDTLGEHQRKFTRLLGLLIMWIYSHGLEATVGEAFRTQEQAQWNAEHGLGIRHSLHCERLAFDLNLFKDGVFQTDIEAYRPAGEYWMSLDPDCAWGGLFAEPDIDHFSLSWQGAS